jgi:nucleotide-binding universal stress UspA family protein
VLDQPNDVVVGVDGSEPSGTAVRWAAAETGRGGGRLRIVLANRQRPGEWLLTTDDVDEFAREQAHAIVGRAAAEARQVAPGIHVAGTAVVAGPTTAMAIPS